MLVTVVACNEEYNTDVEETASSAAVRSFGFEADDSVLAHLDSVFFSVDLVSGRIFNADSLPVGTDITALVPVITTLDGCSVAELTVKRSNNTDTVYDYINTPSARIDFTNPVRLRLVSPDGLVERHYTITVNVHNMDPDSLYWNRKDRRNLPSKFNYPTSQHTSCYEDQIACLTEYQGAYSLATLSNSLSTITGFSPDLGEWIIDYVSFPMAVDINTFTVGDGSLYILGVDGSLLESVDGGSTWVATGRSWTHIYGVYQGKALGSALQGGNWEIQEHPGASTYAMPDGMPVSGTSAPVFYSFPMSTLPQMMVVGGRTAKGSLSAHTWGFDGKAWARVSKRGVPVAVENAAVAPYTSIKVAADWNTTDYPTMVLIGGRLSDGSLNDTVYVSNDFGANWIKADTKMQLPDYLPAMQRSQAFVITSTLSATEARSRISQVSDEWACPYIYLFGGVNAAGNTSNNVWRGVINRLSFKPIE